MDRHRDDEDHHGKGHVDHDHHIRHRWWQRDDDEQDDKDRHHDY